MSHRARLLALLQRQGPLSSAAVQRELGISRPTLSRLMRETDGEILRLGQTRRVRYAAPRRIEGLPAYIPVARVDENGRAHIHAHIRPLEPEEWAWESESGELRIGTGLPREVADLWPAGCWDSRLNGNMATDTETGRLTWMIEQGHDLPGNLVVGDQALAQFMQLDPAARTLDELPAMASQADAGEVVGAPLGGQWPKFTAWMENHHILVKYARLDDTPAGQRRADLLVAEVLALETLQREGMAGTPARLIDRDGWRFLALARFDRVGRLGRRGVIRLSALSGKGIDPADWSQSARALQRSARLSSDDARTILWRETFAALIANNDRHGDNLAFFNREDEQLTLAPAFDMLPMAAAPNERDEVPEQLPAPPLPAGGELDIWRDCARAAADYWQRLANEQRVSFDFRKLAAAQGKAIAERVERLG